MNARSLIDRLERLVIERGLLVLAVAGVLTALLAAGYAQLGWTNDPEVITLEGSPELAFYREYVRRWGSDELIVLAWAVDDAFDPAELERLRDLTNALLDLPDVAWVSSLDTAFSIDTGPLGPYPRPLVADDIRADPSLRERALASPFIRDSLVSSDGRTLLLAVELEARELDNTEQERRALDALLEVLERPDFSEMDIHLAGSPVFNREMTRLNQRDNALFTPLAVGLIALLLLLSFRSLWATSLAMGVVGVSLVWTLGAMGWLGVPMNVTTSLLAPLLMVVAIADAVHLVSTHLDRLAAGDDRGAALSFTLHEVLPACFWTTATTVAGFSSLLLVRIESVRVFGSFAVLGVLLAFAATTFVLPAALARAPLERSARPRAPLRILSGLTRLSRRPSWAWALAIAGLSVAISGAPRIEVATHDGEFFRPDNPINLAYRFIEDRLEGVTPFEAEVQAPAPGLLRTAEGVRVLHALQGRLAAEPGLSGGTSLADLLRSISPEIELDDDDAIDRSLFLLEALAPGEAERFVNDAARRARISARAVAMTSAESEALIERLRSEADTVLPPGWTVRFTGLVPVFSQMEQYLVEGQLRSWGVALFAVALAFAWIFRSLRLGALALGVNLIPIGVAAGVMGWTGMRLDVATIMVAAVALGIIVDDTIHLVTAYRRGLDRDLSPDDALAHALDVAGRPIVLTSVILVCGFATLGLSDFQPTAHFGVLVSVAVAGALVADLGVLPAALPRFGAPPRPADRIAFQSSNEAPIPGDSST